MMQIVVLLFLKTGLVAYTLPKDYGQEWICEEAIENIKEHWTTTKGAQVAYSCKLTRFISSPSY